MTEPQCERCWVQDTPPVTSLWHSPDFHDKEHPSMTETPIVDELEAKIAAQVDVEADYAARGLTPDGRDPQQVAAERELEDNGGYHIHPAADPDEEVDEEIDAAPNAETAFLVVVTPDGSAFATSELHKITEILTRREATVVDMRRACQEVVYDVNAMQTAQQTVGLMQQQAQAMAEEQRNAKIAAKLQSKGIHVPTGSRR